MHAILEQAAAQGRPAEVDVLIVGGSLVGLSAAAFLGSHGIRPLVVERHAGTSIHPRAGYFHVGTMEAFRRIGLEPAILTASGEQFGPDGGINAVESLAGRELARHVPDINAGLEPYSPCKRFFMTQQSLEPLLHARAAELGARLSYRSELTGFEQGKGHVLATIRDLDSGREANVRARYMIAADGNRSPVRETLGIAMEGPSLLSNSITIYFKADCRPWLEGRQLGVIYVVNADQRGFFRFEADGKRGFLAVNTLGDLSLPDAKDVAGDTSLERCIELVRSAVGVPDLEVEIEDVATWRATAECAAAFRTGRIFLAGDAAHVVPPTGGFGGNTGVQDAANLAWKLASVLEGKAGEALLDSYEEERRPVGLVTVEQAYARYIRRVVPEEIDVTTPQTRDELTMEIGQRYGSGAVAGGRSLSESACLHPDETRGHPGSRVPHAWLGEQRSTIDCATRGFALLTGPNAGSWRRAAEALALEEVTLPGDALESCGIGLSGALLDRPDGYVAWRAEENAPDAEDLLRATLARILSRE
jgi:2-polyprenyl-6-methoxyphenol hydroxylase-like FAD-dependent oxidoreductase